MALMDNSSLAMSACSSRSRSRVVPSRRSASLRGTGGIDGEYGFVLVHPWRRGRLTRAGGGATRDGRFAGGANLPGVPVCGSGGHVQHDAPSTSPRCIRVNTSLMFSSFPAPRGGDLPCREAQRFLQVDADDRAAHGDAVEHHAEDVEQSPGALTSDIVPPWRSIGGLFEGPGETAVTSAPCAPPISRLRKAAGSMLRGVTVTVAPRTLGQPQLVVVHVHRRHVEPHRSSRTAPPCAEPADAGHHHPVAGRSDLRPVDARPRTAPARSR